MSMGVDRLLVLLLLLSQFPTKVVTEEMVTPCPVGCRCSSSLHGSECRQTAECAAKLDRFPKADQYPTDLDCLFMSSPKLRKLSEEKKAEGLRAIPKSVRRLDLSGCRLGTIPAGGVLAHLDQVRVLNLEFNNLEWIPEDAFHGLSKLKVR